MTNVATMIAHSRPSIAQADVDAVADVVRSAQLAQGACVDRFEQGMASFFGLQGGVAVSSGTAALELALRALRIGPGDEVVMPSYVCAAPWLAVQRVGAQARLADIDPRTFNIDPASVRQVLTRNTRTIIVPHLFGLPADLTALEQIGVPLIEDCAQTLGAMERGRPVGTVGTLTVCSFYATKMLCAGEGGMVLSKDAALLDRVRELRQYDEAGALNAKAFNYKMTDVAAAIGCCQLARLQTFLDRRAALAESYREALASATAVLPSVPPGRTHCYYRFVVTLTDAQSRSGGLAGLVHRFEQRGVSCRKPVFRPIHRFLNQSGFHHSEEADRTALSIPLYPDLSDEEVLHIQSAFREVLA